MSLEPITCDPELWGKHLWYTMEAIACTVNPHNRKEIQSFFESLKTVIPCPTCQAHYCHFYDTHPIHSHLEDPIALIEWLYLLKQDIKQRQDRPIPTFVEYMVHIIDYYQLTELYDWIERRVS